MPGINRSTIHNHNKIPANLCLHFFVFLVISFYDGASPRYARPNSAPPCRPWPQTKLQRGGEHLQRNNSPTLQRTLAVGRPSPISTICCVSDHTIMPVEEGRGKEPIQTKKFQTVAHGGHISSTFFTLSLHVYIALSKPLSNYFCGSWTSCSVEQPAFAMWKEEKIRKKGEGR